MDGTVGGGTVGNEGTEQTAAPAGETSPEDTNKVTALTETDEDTTPLTDKDAEKETTVRTFGVSATPTSHLYNTHHQKRARKQTDFLHGAPLDDEGGTNAAGKKKRVKTTTAKPSRGPENTKWISERSRWEPTPGLKPPEGKVWDQNAGPKGYGGWVPDKSKRASSRGAAKSGEIMRDLGLGKMFEYVSAQSAENAALKADNEKLRGTVTHLEGKVERRDKKIEKLEKKLGKKKGE